MDYRDYRPTRLPKLTRIERPEDLDAIEFVDGIAEVEVPVELLRALPLKNHKRRGSERLRRLEQSIRNNGYGSMQPIVARIGRAGKWVIVDGGHRLTAAKHVSEEIVTNLLRRKVGILHFLLFETAISREKLRAVAPDLDLAGKERALEGPLPDPDD